MLGSNNEVAVLEAVLSSLAQSPAFALLEPNHTENVIEHQLATPKPHLQLAG